LLKLSEVLHILHRKIDFVEVFKNLGRYRSENNVVELLNNYVESLNKHDDKTTKSFNILTTSLNVLYNYFNDPNKIIFRSS